MSEKWYEYWWHSLKGISRKKREELFKNKIKSEDIFNIEETRKTCMLEQWLTEEEIKIIQSSRREKDWKREYDILQEKGIRMILRGEKEYPKRFAELPDMPQCLFVKGNLPGEHIPVVAIVGARNCTSYGEICTLQFAETLAGAGVQIISGMARGFDGAAHRGALNMAGKTYAVLGCGADVCYPKEHRGLYGDIQKEGGIISEYLPGTQPLSHHFPQRNRIISALADVVLVMEAKEKSGSLITADIALEQGKDVYALPGPVCSELSKGCNYLIRQGAGILLSPEELLEELSVKKAWEHGNCQNNKKILEPKEKIVYSNLGLFPKGREELLELTGLEPQELAGILISLELNGHIREISKNHYIKREF